MTARAIMVQGTASSAGKSIIVTALCRILRQDGYSVAPFKAQNMALNSFVTKEGGEIGRSQAVQAHAAGIEPTVDMNPVLLKPQADNRSQLIIRGRAAGITNAEDYYKTNRRLLSNIRKSYNSLAGKHDIIIIEGAGSPAEINLAKREIVNMRIARMTGAPVLLVGDIDHGGVFASFAGTITLLPPSSRKLVRGFIINKFRGDAALLKPAVDFMERRYSRPVLGIIPYIRDLQVAQEDSVYLNERYNGEKQQAPDICIIHLPHISNYDDFDALEYSCNVRYISSIGELGKPDLIILPGTKSTIDDMNFLKKSGLSDAITSLAQKGTPVIGICGGYQMLGKSITDRHQAESVINVCSGLGLLDVDTVFEPVKITTQVQAVVRAGNGLLRGIKGTMVKGYEIHMGRDGSSQRNPAFTIIRPGNTRPSDGAVNRDGTVFGTYIHGLFDNAEFTEKFIGNLCEIRGLPYYPCQPVNREKSYDRLADVVRENININKIYEYIFGGKDGRQ